MKPEELERIINELKLQIQQLEERVKDLEDGSFGTGVYLEGCSESTIDYLSKKDKKEGM